MKIKQEIVNALNTVKNRRTISFILNISDQTVYNHLKANSENGILTKLLALRIISDITGIAIDDIVTDQSSEIIANEK